MADLEPSDGPRKSQIQSQAERGWSKGSASSTSVSVSSPCVRTNSRGKSETGSSSSSSGGGRNGVMLRLPDEPGASLCGPSGVLAGFAPFPLDIQSSVSVVSSPASRCSQDMRRIGSLGSLASSRPASSARTASRPGSSGSPTSTMARISDEPVMMSSGGVPPLLPPILGASPRELGPSSQGSGVRSQAKSNTSARARLNLKTDLSVVTTNSARTSKAASELFKVLGDNETVNDFYELSEEIHDGGNRGSVRLATRRSDDAKVIVKIRKKQRGKLAERRWRTVMEQLQELNNSRHVLGITEILEDNSNFYVVMPRCNGGELFTFLVTEAEVPEAECKRIIREILVAVGHLHNGGLIHRDIKPENILFDLDKTTPESPKTVKLIDFDTCAEWTPETPKCKRFVGTPGYIAPEVLLGEASPQSDLWSVGVILYILMTGFTPWTQIETLEDGFVGSASSRRMYNSIKQATTEWEADPWPAFPLARDLCQRLMAFRTDDRPLTAKDALSHEWLRVDFTDDLH
eukprot:TRINITY_DN49863_c0_g1_i1.p1 TRINITY_DN49863_c0_g1~~TRINITY_DN49863_c0_g1_i1.p1  ORF type:complete len:518 (-),score=86.12 TRINITY_DN49863_c0_g1_i1:189-1742(-)